MPIPFKPLLLRRSRGSTCEPKGTADWRRRVPSLESDRVRLREVRVADAAALVRHLCDSRVRRHLPPGPISVAEFRRFIIWARKQRAAGRLVCFAVVPARKRQPVGIMQLWSAEPAFATAEWGFALGHDYWGTGLFRAAADLMLPFAFYTAGVTRLEAQTAASNERGNGALRKLGGTPTRGGQSRRKDDPITWLMLASDCFGQRAGSVA